MVRIAVDVMGSDREPSVLIEGACRAVEQDPDLRVLAFGSEEALAGLAHERVEGVACTEVITMAEHPTTAVRHKKDASIVRAAKAVRAGEADGLFSAGSTGAVLTAASLGVGRIKGIRRPALASALPGASGAQTVFLDMGANADVRPADIVQFAHMGRAYARVVLGVENPRVGLLSNGAEETKGSEQALAYHAALAEADCNFAGNAEGGDLLAGTFDVIVADGFTGNVALKSLEGTAKFIVAQLKAATKASPLNALGALMLKGALKETAANLSGDAYGGAVLLGLTAPVIKGHGSTSSEAVCNGTLAAARAVRGNLVGSIRGAIAPDA